ncbi:similar to Saccharomyces cerevisiae YOR219C STE13 Dipeptidyl aminopeptidase [Maudiozyma saulgeensis]|uniref:Similar to Saccharomyces cerevisiae YOR219C STE13 Dipeptidyl aminopeptidase n=1 Tax=Maudiozyma saulgeensis TaxID=1789683 RepID=A0A1X7R970_9SACH|nr:similar to Saccharomyces cerevisiae YOR219C STE13 Dipeptidyl aminopeptidase [Kazachstania saulgeensis]
MTSDKIHTHKRKNSHLFNEQSTSGSSIRTDYDISMDNLEMENMGPPPIGRTTSIPSVPIEPSSAIDLENQDRTLGNLESSESWDDWYLTRKFGQNKKLRTTIYSIFGIIIAYIIVLLIISLSSNKGADNGNTSNEAKPNEQQNSVKRDKSFDIEDVMKGKFLIDKNNFHFIDPPYRFDSHDMDPGLYMTTVTNDDGTRFLAKQLFNEEFLRDLGPNKFEYQDHEYVVDTIKVNYALDKLIFATDKIGEFRHSSSANYWIKDVTKDTIRPISPYFDSEQPVRLSYVYFSPGYNFIYFVMDNNLYFQDINAEHAPVKVTSDGNENIRNAKTDWVYEEEVLADDRAIWWAPDDSKFIFAKFNDTNVDSYTFPRYTTDQQYPPLSEIKYPTPSRVNPTIELFFYNIGGNMIYNVNMDQKNMKEIILYDAEWIGPENFLFKITDRFSKELFVKVFNTDKVELLNTRNYNTKEFKGWVEKTKKVFVIPPSEKAKRIDYGYIDIHQDNEGYNHMFYYNSPSATKGQQLTKGEWEITGSGVVGYEHETDTIYFTANHYHPMSQNLFAVRLEGDPINELVTLQDPSMEHTFYDYEISSSSRYAVMEYLGPSLPFYAAGTLTNLFSLEAAQSNDVLVLSNKIHRDNIETKYNLPITSFKSMTLDDGTSVNYIEIKPANMNVKRKHPLLINVYGGPGSQTFTAKSGISLEQAVVSGLDAIVLQIEPRGTGGKGWKFRSWASEALGYWEPRDITEVTKKFIHENGPHIDRDKVAIWGWSYGGFSTLKTIEFDKGETFKYAIAVAPVTNWLYYDSIYTERYMGDVGTNIDKYIEISRVSDISGFENMKRFMLVHGTADDNVHIQNTYKFTDRLNIAGIRNYDMHIFPDSDHSIRYHNAQNIIYKKLYYWIEEAFNGLLDNINH